MQPVTLADVVAGLRSLDLGARPVCLHASLSSFGNVVGGAEAIVDAFADAGCTLMVPSFSFRFLVLPTEALRPARNAWDYERPPNLEAAATFTPEAREIDARMGAVAEHVVAHPERVRGDHPLCSFTAIGAEAGGLVGGQTWEDVYAPLRSLAAHEGAVLLAGTRLTSVTLLHEAEHAAGRTLFRRWALGSDGVTRMVPVGSCSNGFEKLAPILAPLATTTIVGASSLVSYPAAAALESSANAIRETPELTRCANPDCVRCRDSIAGGPLLVG
jgi:aminoglycoside 3-N-acetyltransferase